MVVRASRPRDGAQKTGGALAFANLLWAIPFTLDFGYSRRESHSSVTGVPTKSNKIKAQRGQLD